MWSTCGPCGTSRHNKKQCAIVDERVYFSKLKALLCNIIRNAYYQTSKYYNYYIVGHLRDAYAKCRTNITKSHRRVGRSVGLSVVLFVMKNELATRSSPKYIASDSWFIYTQFRVLTRTTTQLQTHTNNGMRLIWFNKRNKVKAEKPNCKTFCAQGEIIIGAPDARKSNTLWEGGLVITHVYSVFFFFVGRLLRQIQKLHHILIDAIHMQTWMSAVQCRSRKQAKTTVCVRELGRLVQFAELY